MMARLCKLLDKLFKGVICWCLAALVFIEVKAACLIYVPNSASDSVSVIDAATNTILITITGGFNIPVEVAVTPNGALAYVTNEGSDSVSVIDTATHTVVNTVAAESQPDAVAFTPDGALAYVTNQGSNSVSVIDTATHMV